VDALLFSPILALDDLYASIRAHGDEISAEIREAFNDALIENTTALGFVLITNEAIYQTA
jgi:hypothetical protein